MIFIACKNCKAKLSSILMPENEKTWADYKDYSDMDFVESGFYIKDLAGNYILNITDKRNLNFHADKNRLVGCCGPSEGELSNLVCRCSSEIGREISDCICPHYTRISFEQVIEIKDKWGIFSVLKDVENHNPINEELNYFYQLMQFGDEASAIEYFNSSLMR
jgi:hypothetical protein